MYKYLIVYSDGYIIDIATVEAIDEVDAFRIMKRDYKCNYILSINETK